MTSEAFSFFLWGHLHAWSFDASAALSTHMDVSIYFDSTFVWNCVCVE